MGRGSGAGSLGGAAIVEQPAAAGWSALARSTLDGSTCVLAVGVDDAGRIVLHAVAPAPAPAPARPAVPVAPAPSPLPGGRRPVAVRRPWGWFWTDGSAAPVFPLDPAWGLTRRIALGCAIGGLPHAQVLLFDDRITDRHNAVQLSLPHDRAMTLPQPGGDPRTRSVLHAAAPGLVVRWEEPQ